MTEGPSSGSAPPAGADDHPRPASTDPTLAATGELDRPLPDTIPEGEPDALLEQGTIGRYEIHGVLGSGGMGTVLEAHDTTLDRPVALKVLHHGVGDRHAARLKREAQALAALSHPGVVRVYEVGTAGERTFIAMERVTGQTLDRWQLGPPVPPWRERLRVYLEAGEGLAAAHAEGLIHRDFKPGNVMIGEDGRVRVLDFGLARRDEDASSGDGGGGALSVAELDSLSSPLTRTGAVLGTPAYMPLEQMQGGEVDGRADQFSFCVALYEALYGERPFDAASVTALMVALVGGHVRPPPDHSEVPEAVRRVIVRGLARAPDDRWPSMRTLLDELRRRAAPRRWGRIGLAGVAAAAAALAIGVGRGAGEAEPAPCDAAAKLDGIWDDGRRAEVEAAILGTELPYAPDTWTRVERRLDSHAERWRARHDELCEAARGAEPPPELDLRMRCLERDRVALGEVAAVLADATASRVSEAVTLVSSLPEASRCDDVEALRSSALPPPADPVVAAEAEALRQQLARARTLRWSAEDEQALESSSSVVERAEALGYAPLVAEARLERAESLRGLGRYEDAERDAEQAHMLAAEHRHLDVELEAATLLISIVGADRTQRADGLRWGKTALALLERSGGRPLVEARVKSNIGSVLRVHGELDEALEHYQEALAIRESVLEPDDLLVASSFNAIGVVHDLQGRGTEALEDHRRALAVQEEALGSRHPVVGTTLNNIGLSLQNLGRLDEALVELRRSLEIREQALGPEHPLRAQALGNTGIVLSALGRHAEALELHRRALAIKEKTSEPTSPKLAGSLTNIGIELLATGERDEALAHHQRALAIFEEALGAEHPAVAMSRANIANVLLRLDRLEPAREQIERAIEIWEGALGARHPVVASAAVVAGDIRRLQGQGDEARTWYRRSADIVEETMGPDHVEVVAPLVGLAEVALAGGSVEEARPLAERAHEISESGDDEYARASARLVLAKVRWHQPEHRSQARALAEQARDLFTEVGANAQREAAEARAWLEAHPL